MATSAQRQQGREVPVTIKIEPNGNITVSPENFIVSKGKNEEVMWVCTDPNAYFTVEFDKNGSPFYETQFSSHCPCSGLVRRDVLPDDQRIYDYTVRTLGRKIDPGGGVSQ